MGCKEEEVPWNHGIEHEWVFGPSYETDGAVSQSEGRPSGEVGDRTRMDPRDQTGEALRNLKGACDGARGLL